MCIERVVGWGCDECGTFHFRSATCRRVPAIKYISGRRSNSCQCAISRTHCYFFARRSQSTSSACVKGNGVLLSCPLGVKRYCCIIVIRQVRRQCLSVGVYNSSCWRCCPSGKGVSLTSKTVRCQCRVNSPRSRLVIHTSRSFTIRVIMNLISIDLILCVESCCSSFSPFSIGDIIRHGRGSKWSICIQYLCTTCRIRIVTNSMITGSRSTMRNAR